MSRSPRRDQIRRLLARREREGLTYRELAAISGESANTLAWWASRLRREHEREVGFVELVPVDEGQEEVEADGQALAVQLANGHRVLVPNGFDEKHLARLLRVLVRAC